jgi:hypothetical protein
MASSRHTPGVPGTKLPKATQELVVRPKQNSHADSDPPPSEDVDVGFPEVESPSRIEQEAFRHDVHAHYGKGSFRGPAWVFLVVAFVAGAVALTWFLTRHSDSARPPQDEVLSAVNALKVEVDKSNAAKELHDALVLQRIGALETQNGATQARLDALLRGGPVYPSPPLNVPVSQALTQPHR